MANFWEEVVKLNNWHQHRISRLIIKKLFGTVSGKKICILGFSFKSNTNDTRESAAINVTSSLLKKGANINIYDPMVSKKSMKNGKPLIEDPMFSSEVAELEIDLLAMEIFNLRTVSAAAEGKAPGMESSLLKIKGTLVRQKTTELLRKALGPQALPYLPEQFDEGWNEMPIGPEYAGPIAKQYFNMRKISIYGGSNEIQKNIVAKASFGL